MVVVGSGQSAFKMDRDCEEDPRIHSLTQAPGKRLAKMKVIQISSKKLKRYENI